MLQFSVGYHRVSDDSVSSALLEVSETMARLVEVRDDTDINQYWVRDAQGRILATWEKPTTPVVDTEDIIESLTKFTRHFTRGLMTNQEYVEEMGDQLRKVAGYVMARP